MNQKIITVVLISLIVIFAGAAIYFAKAKNEAQKQANLLIEKNNQIEKDKVEMQKQISDLKKGDEWANSLPNESGSMLSGIMQSKIKAQKASIKSSMASTSPMAIMCEDENGTILSGNGGDKVCTAQDYTWPVIAACGPNVTDTEWIVKNGAESNWDVVLECKGMTDCNGPQNAICNSFGCEFKGSCQ
ncbi:MAG: hypothetical protein WAV31_05125 [Candidatus Moraniibacteriota bacterium]